MEVTAVEVETKTRKQKTSPKPMKSNAENVNTSPVVRRTRRSQISKQVVFHESSATSFCTIC